MRPAQMCGKGNKTMTDTTRSSVPRKILVGGKWIESRSARFESVTDPTTNEVIGRVPLCSKSETDAAIEAAAKAFEIWRDVPAPRRAAILFKYQNILLREQNNLAHLVSQEHGKVLSDAAGSVRRGIDMVEFATGVPSLMQGAHPGRCLIADGLPLLAPTAWSVRCNMPVQFPGYGSHVVRAHRHRLRKRLRFETVGKDPAHFA